MCRDTENRQEQEGPTNEHEEITRATYLYAFCAALNSCNLGYDLGVSTNAGPLIAQSFSLSRVQLEMFLGSLNFWSILGALLSPIVTDRYGRRATFQCAAVGFLVGITVMVTSKSFLQLMFGRMIVGIGVGIGEAVDPMYIAEIAPKALRGQLVSWAEAGVSTGVVFGFCSSLVFYNVVDVDKKWRYMLAAGAILPVVMMALVKWVMPESPRWLMAQQQEASARTILQTMYKDPAQLDHVVEEIRESLELEQEAAHAVGWDAIIRPSPAVRRMLIVGVGIAILQQAVGIDSVMFYLMYVIQGTGIQSDLLQILALILLGTVKLAFVFVGARLFDKLGRRPLLFASLLGCAGSLVMVSVTFWSTSAVSKLLTVLGLALYLAFFSSGLGPGNWVVVSEIFATSIRAKAMSVAVLPNRITATIMASTFLSMAKALTWPGFFMFLALICLLGALFLFVYLPETKGKSLEEMAVYFAEITGDRSILDVEARLGKHRHHPGDLELESTLSSPTEESSLKGTMA